MSLWLLIRNGNKYIPISCYNFTCAPFFLHLLWKIVKQVFFIIIIIIIILLSNKHPYMFVTRKKPTKKQCKQDISIYHEHFN